MAEPPLTESDFEYLDTALKPEPFVDDFFSEMALSAPDSATIAVPPEPAQDSENPVAGSPEPSAPDIENEGAVPEKTSLIAKLKQVLAAWRAKLKPVKPDEGTEPQFETEATMAPLQEEVLIPFDDTEAESRPSFFKRHALMLILAAGILTSASLAIGVVWFIKHRATPPHPETAAISHPPAPLPATASPTPEAELAALRAKNTQLEQELKQAQKKNTAANAAEAPNPDDCIITGKEADYQKNLKDCIKAFNTLTGRPSK